MRPVERLDLVEAIAHSPRSRGQTVLTFQPRINLHVAATSLRGEPHHPISDRRPFERALLKALAHQQQSSAIPE